MIQVVTYEFTKEEVSSIVKKHIGLSTNNKSIDILSSKGLKIEYTEEMKDD